ncbi:MAG: hypothetical protein A3D24_00335 [Candidatus Blackburnbacteria bacterium RIFCSPHIGHO2_02_FULL_39_13]|uniref:HMA domain-containing protein n=1 Tax=Candidatus Blackburnbacteria bacterium RIFCSPLOWO2_01_FULL_40_20 TaxID=1797519 RepID=A0A1G1VFN4_9BACT|nr:MAG: hypothetical protein UT38_C0017G0030 [Microgenomates group bacterium GW2011_GWA2_39_19]OGY07528.1 MAG: hypothetical protein A2694_04700 [Candidatus Blackburnbacteria bacterium RIFCSPHIGHO2_01_FULL_40_17]OGY08610.1 MAG: hypothetical protein A3D24_00335 [Candidatus Blackburnbacteria bacterium RIFCSPHIGHO2_02_FULL_39_13]OGY14245.1 MAG: hypothetical protein A3A77_02095 [Candidatus Blackburnbacteria bacterium RIFCSPLOWO2_01_FULL_40_20]OGY14572.1 MAG: hypothetical protein A3I52_00290 [Candida
MNNGQDNKPKVLRFSIKGMHCPSCAILIESDLEDAGVKVSCSYAKQLLEVETPFRSQASEGQAETEKTVKKVVEDLGYKIEAL